MTWKEWTAVAVVLGGAVAVQVVGHDAPDEHDDHEHSMEAGQHAEQMEHAPAGPVADGPFRTVTLEVSGMA
jgi:hypothetical protein